MDIVHEPIVPPRKDVIGERVFLKKWQELCATSPYSEETYSNLPFLRQVLNVAIYGKRKQVTQREATVSASFVKWLGTNVGNCFLDGLLRAGKEAALLGERNACAEFWAKENTLEKCMGYRRIQTIIATKEDYAPDIRFGITIGLARWVSYSAHDVDVIEAICMWLGATEEGRAFAGECNKLVRAHNDRRYRAKQAAHSVRTHQYRTSKQ